MNSSSLLYAVKPSIAGAVLALAGVFAGMTPTSAAGLSDLVSKDVDAGFGVSERMGREPETGVIRLAGDVVEVAVSDRKGEKYRKQKKEEEHKAPPPKNPITDTDYEALVNNTAGFGQNATGGLGFDLCRVTTLDDSGGGSLRKCATKGDRWVVFDVSGEIALESMIRIANNTTIDGRGADITITDYGFSTGGRENIIIHNLKIEDVEGDGIGVYEARDIWINHVTVGNTTDGAIDITDQSEHVTVSWTHLKDQNKTMLIGNNNDKVDDDIITVTLHHNWYDGTMRRNPLVRYALVHMYNNVLTHWGNSMGGDAVNSVYHAQMLLESNIFNAGANKQVVFTVVPNWVEVPGYVKARGNSPLNGARVFSSNADKVFEASDFYDYRLDIPNNGLENAVKAYAGWQPAEFFEGNIFAYEALARGIPESGSEGN